MALIVKDRVKEISTISGTGPIIVQGTSPGYQAFGAVLSTGDTTYYCAADRNGPHWEVGIGQYIAANNSILRLTVLESSNNNALVDFSANTKDVFITNPAERILEVPYGGTGGSDSLSARFNLGLEIGTDVQAYSADLSAIAEIGDVQGLLRKTAVHTWEVDTAEYQTAADVSVAIQTAVGSISQRYEFLESQVWEVVHNMNTRSFMERLTDSSGNRIYAALNIIDQNRFTINLTSATSGSIDVFFLV